MYTKNIAKCFSNISSIIKSTPLEYNQRLSNIHYCNIFLKREDIQLTRSFKIRGASNKIINNMNIVKNNGVVCASAGNHAQGIAYCCNKFNIDGTIFIPNNTPLQKKKRIEFFGGKYINIIQHGNNFNECLDHALNYSKDKLFIHPFDDDEIINGQATVAHEIHLNIDPNYIISCVGGGGLLSGIKKYSNEKSPNCKLIGVEPSGAASLTYAQEKGKPIMLENVDTFVDGGSVSKIGYRNFNILKNIDVYTATNEEIANIMIDFYEYDGIILEPAGALSIAGLNKLKFNSDDNVVCILSGGNNDISRYPEIIDLNLRFLNKKHYFIIKFAQKPGQLTSFMRLLGDNDDITRFEYIKKTNKNFGDVLICIESDSIHELENKLDNSSFNYKKINPNDLIYNYLI